MSGKYHAVLTGDLVKSSRLTGDEMLRARAAILGAAKAAGGWRTGLIPARSEFFRDDSWQVLLAEPGEALRVALFLRARLLATGLTDTRIAVGIGPVSQIEPRRVSLSRGEAFVLSGEALDGLKRPNRMAFAVAGDLAGSDWAGVVIGLCDAIAETWKPVQASVMALALGPGDLRQEDIAVRLGHGLSAQAVGKSLRGAGWPAVAPAIRQFAAGSWQPPAHRGSKPPRSGGPRKTARTPAPARTRK